MESTPRNRALAWLAKSRDRHVRKAVTFEVYGRQKGRRKVYGLHTKQGDAVTQMGTLKRLFRKVDDIEFGIDHRSSPYRHALQKAWDTLALRRS